ncbi:hypothetical protein [Nocardia altamirensis]|uniref:hypothetical protein n=1 Tax=Nocardia altamirensis TaxID=472158 RepID=UPI00083FF7AF|nr:hypothetical protein [Nocardia altamirensis]
MALGRVLVIGLDPTTLTEWDPEPVLAATTVRTTPRLPPCGGCGSRRLFKWEFGDQLVRRKNHTLFLRDAKNLRS